MLKNYFITTIRNLLKKRTFSFLNIAGLAIGIATASLIFLWVEDELTFNHNFSKRNNLYQVYENQTYEGKVSTFIATPGAMAKAMVLDIPGIKNAARADGTGEQLFALGDKSINEMGNYADSALFSLLQLPFVYGQPAGAFRQLHSLVINETMSHKFFGDADPVGKTLKMNNEQDYTITGVFKDLPGNSSFQFHWLAPMDNIDHKQAWMQGWSGNWARTYVELEPSADVAAVNKQLATYLTKKNNNSTACFLFAMNDWNLHDNFTDGKMDGGRIQYVKLFSLIAWIILLIACINFMNLSTARSEQRAKEVGVRKVMGAGKGKLIGQFITEAIVMSFIAVLIAVALVYVLLPYFNTLVEKELSFIVFSPVHIAYLAVIGIVTGLVAGSYPAFYLSSFNPIKVLKGIRQTPGSSSGFIRKSLVVTQFSISIILIIGTVIIYQQIQFVKNREMGYDKSNLVYIKVQGTLDEHFNSVYHDLQQTGLVENATLSDQSVVQIWKNTDDFSWQGKDPARNPLITWENVNEPFIATMGMTLTAGRNFYADAEADSNTVIINEALAAEMGKEGRPGAVIKRFGKSYTVAGIIKNFLYNTMYQPGAPFLMYNHPLGTRFLTIRIKPTTHLADALAKVEKVLKDNNPAYPVSLQFVDDEFNELFKAETLTGKLAGLFASLAICISCLGLFGLAAYTAERRIKEIGIRKVLGASVPGLAGLLSKDFLQLVAYSCIISFPLSWWALNNWLQDYSYHTIIHWWVFALAGTGAMLIALATVSFQAIKAAMGNPVKSIRTE